MTEMNRGVGKVIDIHTHMFPVDVIQNQEKYCRLDTYFGVLADPKCTIQRYATAEEAIALADEAGVEIIVMQGWYWRDHGLCRYHNDYMAEILKKHPERFIAFASVNPRTGWKTLAEMERCKSMGFRGVGEMGPGGQGWELNDRNFLRLMDACAEANMVVNIHAGEPVGKVYPGKDFTPLQGFYELAKRLPSLKLILAHWGGGLPYYELWPEIKKTMHNVYYDAAGTPLLYDMQVFRTVIDLVGREKILFGSDFPLLLYPRKKQQAEFATFIEAIRLGSWLTQEEQDFIFYQNASRLFAR